MRAALVVSSVWLTCAAGLAAPQSAPADEGASPASDDDTSAEDKSAPDSSSSDSGPSDSGPSDSGPSDSGPASDDKTAGAGSENDKASDEAPDASAGPPDAAADVPAAGADKPSSSGETPAAESDTPAADGASEGTEEDQDSPPLETDEEPAAGGWWKDADRAPGEGPSVQPDLDAIPDLDTDAEDTASTGTQPRRKRDRLPAPRSDPYASVASGAGVCAAATCAPPFLTAVGVTTGGAALFMNVPSALLAVMACLGVGLLCGGPATGLCVGALAGPVGTTAAAAALPFLSDDDEDEAGWDAVVGGLPGILIGIAALLVIPPALVFAYLAATVALVLGGLAAAASGPLLLFVVVPLGLLPSIVLAALAPVVTLIGVSAARIQYAASGPAAAAVAQIAPPQRDAVAMRF